MEFSSVDTTISHKVRKRLYYIDYVRAIAIVGVINVHTHVPVPWITGFMVNVTFFFISGMFFKTPNRDRLMSDYRKMLAKDCKTLLLPFLFFYSLSYLFRIMVHLWDFRTFAGFNWWWWLDLFKVCDHCYYMLINGPLWFILCLFVIKCIYFWIRCLPESIIFIIAVAALFLRDITSGIATPFMINKACYWIGFFALGNLFARHVAPQKMPILRRIVMSCIAIAVLVLSLFLEEFVSVMVLQYVRVFAALMMLLFGVSILENVGKLRFLSFIGKNTLILLGSHVWFLIILQRISYKLTGVHTIESGVMATVFCLIFCCFFVLLSSKYFPLLVGKASSKQKTL